MKQALALVGWLALGHTADAEAQSTPNATLPPKGFGTLHQTDVAIVVRTEDVLMTILPLDERVTRLLAVDSYEGLQRIRTDRSDDIRSAVAGRGEGSTQTFLVTIHATSDYARFDPDRITIVSRGRYFRPIAILPISPRWAEHQLDRSGAQSALYVFDRDLDPMHPMIVEYGNVRATSWAQTLRRLEVERSRVEARARGNDLTPIGKPCLYIH